MKISNFIILPLFFLFIQSTLCQVTYERVFPNLSFAFPVELQFNKNIDERCFVIEQQGRIKVFPKINTVNNSQVSTYLDITDRVSYASGQEIGLLGLAFHPQFNTNKYLYVYYTKQSPVSGITVRIVVSRFTVNATNPNAVDPNSELQLFIIDKNQNNNNHNGGKIAFGPDGYLYFSIGDGGGGNDPMNNAQNINSFFGKICRIDVDLDGNNPIESNPILPNGLYEIPTSNTFANTAGLDEIYAYGIRNTWKFSFDKDTNRLWGADVGQANFEEVNLIENGKNYGWKRLEGTTVANNTTLNGVAPTAPVFIYDHSAGDLSITGGYVYKGTQITSINPSINDKYIFADYVSGRVWAQNYNPTTNTATSTLLFKTTGQYVSSFGQDADGELYFSDYGSSVGIYKLKNGTSPILGTAVNGIGIWENLTDGVNGIANCVTVGTDEKIYFGGNFNSASSVPANNIVSWNTTTSTWNSLGTGSNGTINCLAKYNNLIYAGGAFTEIGGISAKNIAVWNGSSWSALSSGIEGPVQALAIDTNGNVFAGGAFEVCGTTTVRNIAKWNGTQWNALSAGVGQLVGTNNEIRALTFDSNGLLYLGGNFDQAGNITANRIATWNGSQWNTLGTGVSGFVQAIITTPQSVFIGGNFANAGSLSVNRIAKWNLSTLQYEKLGNGLTGNVKTLLHDGINLYAAGSFVTALNNSQNIIVNNIASWNSTDGWKPLGQNTSVGVNILVNNIAFAPNDNSKLFVAGNFSTTGNIIGNNVALWKLNVLSNSKFNIANMFPNPNPTNDFISFENKITWQLTNLSGVILEDGVGKEISLKKYPDGIYIIKNIDNGFTYKIIKQN